MKRYWLALTGPILLSGCLGLDPKSSPKDSFTVPVAFLEVVARAQGQAKECWSAEGEFPVKSSIDTASGTARVWVTGILGSTPYAQVDIRALGDRSTEVVAMVSGINMWNRASLAALHEVMQFGVPTCTSYMPRATPR
jgi:hypothetical protein